MPAVDAILRDLNEPQRAAVTHVDGPLLVVAGPGSGKTRVIARRAAWLVHRGVEPGNILAITFTNKAADEMRQRIAALGAARGMWIHTFHALGARLLREFGERAGVRPDFSIYDEADQLRVVREAFEACGLREGLLRPEAALAAIGRAKNRMQSAEEFAAAARTAEERLLARVFAEYERLLEERNAVDFDDLLVRVAGLLRDQADVAERLGRRFRYVLIDEYQDTNRAQYVMARHLAQGHRNICATGDPDQSIYGWRGADLRNILEFERDYPEARLVRLEQNYRSTGCILRVADALIRANRNRVHKTLWTEGGEGAPVEVLQFPGGEQEARGVVGRIVELRAAGRPYGDIAICYRVNALSRALEEALRDAAIPYRIARGLEFYNRKEIKDALAYLRVLVNPADAIALRRILNVPARGIGRTTEELLAAAPRRAGETLLDVLRRAEGVAGLRPAAAQRVRAFVDLLDRMRTLALGASAAAAVRSVLELSGLRAALEAEREDGSPDAAERLENLAELISAAVRYDEQAESPAPAGFLQHVALVSDQDAVDESAGCVMLMTLHAAKGLEFPVVFIVGLEQGVLPHERALRGEGDLEEERRLLFVGITRARERLVLSHCRQRTIAGRPTPHAPSMFLRELPGDGLVVRPLAGADESFVPDDLDVDACEASFEAGVRTPPGCGGESGGRRRGRDGWDGAPAAAPAAGRRRRPLRAARSRASEEPDADAIARAIEPDGSSPYAGWGRGTIVHHARFGVGELQWIRPSPGQTRAAVRFPGVGEKVFILEFSPIRRLTRPSAG